MPEMTRDEHENEVAPLRKAAGNATSGAPAGVHESDPRIQDAWFALCSGHLPVIFWTTDRDLRFTSSIGPGLAGLGLEPNQVVGMSLFEFFQTEERDFEPIRNHYRALEGDSCTFLTEWEDNAYLVWVEPLRDGNGAIAGSVAIALDDTKRFRAERAERELRASERKFRELIERLNDAARARD